MLSVHFCCLFVMNLMKTTVDSPTIGGQPKPEFVDRLYTLFNPLKAGLLPAAAEAEAGLSNPVSFQ
jgi:hypothetical protein